MRSRPARPPVCPAVAAARILACALLFGCSEDSDSQLRPPEDDFLRVPAEFPTIQEAIDHVLPGQSVLVAPGVHGGTGGYVVDFKGKSITLRSDEGPLVTVIACNGDSAAPRGGFLFTKGENGARVEGFTIRGGYAASGVGAYCQNASPTFADCVFEGNHATDSGGAVRCKGASPRFERCTFAGNTSAAGSVLFLIADSSPALVSCILAFNGEGGAVFASDAGSRPSLSCCDVYGNEGGDWAGDIAEQEGRSGNVHLDPQFCAAEEGDYRLRPDSPCAGGGEGGCPERMGALGPGCGPHSAD